MPEKNLRTSDAKRRASPNNESYSYYTTIEQTIPIR